MAMGTLVNRWRAYRSRCRRLGTMLPYRILRRRRLPISLHLDGHCFSVPMDGEGTWIWAQWRPCWRTQLIDTILQKREGIFLDIGANYGQTLADFLAVHSDRRYVGFEPSPECVVFINDIISRNHLSACQIVCAALSDTDKVQQLHFLSGASGDASATLRPEAWGHRTWSTRYVSCYTLDSLWPTLAEKAIALIKIDVEGAELEVLSGMQRTLTALRPPVLCEVLHRNGEVDPESYANRVNCLSSLMHRLGYTILRIRKEEAESEMLGLDEVTAFPTEAWTPENAHECDYLFVSTEQKAACLALV